MERNKKERIKVDTILIELDVGEEFGIERAVEILLALKGVEGVQYGKGVLERLFFTEASLKSLAHSVEKTRMRVCGADESGNYAVMKNITCGSCGNDMMSYGDIVCCENRGCPVCEVKFRAPRIELERHRTPLL